MTARFLGLLSKRQAKAAVDGLRATIDGKRVEITTTDVRSVDGVIRFVKIRSRSTGKLELWMKDLYSPETTVAATYTSVKNCTVSEKPNASASTEIATSASARTGTTASSPCSASMSPRSRSRCAGVAIGRIPGVSDHSPR